MEEGIVVMKGNRCELQRSLLEAFQSYLHFCEGTNGTKGLREALENPRTHRVNAYKICDGKADDLYYERRWRPRAEGEKGPSVKEYRMVRATEGGWLPCFPGPGGGWSTQEPKGKPGIQWGYWRVPVACVDLGTPGVWAEQIRDFFAIEVLYPSPFSDMPDCGEISVRLKILMDRFHGRPERNLCY